MEQKVYILGGAQTDFERNWTKEGKNAVALLKEAVRDGLQDAGMTWEEMETLNQENRIACFVGNFIAERYIGQGHLGGLLTEVHPAFYGVPAARYEAACASGSAAIDAASSKIRCGDYDAAVVVGWELMKTVDSKTGGDILGRAAFYEEEGKDTAFPFPRLFGQLADEYINRYQLDEKRLEDNLAEIAVKNYRNGKRNPSAQTRKWFMSHEQAETRGTSTNPYIGGRLAVSDCSQVTDGAAVVVLCSEKYRKKKDCTASWIKGFGHRVAPMRFKKKIEEGRTSEYILPWTRQAVLDAYERAEMTVRSIDFFETHDCFTTSEYMAISAFGITAPGREYEAVENKVTDFRGGKPVNPSGGLIGCGHPVGATGVRMLLDLHKQVVGKAGAYQVPGAKNGMMLNIGGTATTNYAFIVGA